MTHSTTLPGSSTDPHDPDDVSVGASPLSPRHRSGRWFDVVVPFLLGAATFVVHPLGNVMHQPYSVDEAWVAAFSRAPLSQWFTLSSSSPLGWQFLVRMLTFGHDERARLITLIFGAGAVALAYAAVRELPWPSRVAARGAALAASITILVAPISLFRNDLKQYAADTFVAILLVLLTWRAESSRSRRALGFLVMTTVVALPFSSVTPFIAFPLFGGLLASAAIARNRSRVIEILAAGAAALIPTALYFGVVLLPHDNAALRYFWRAQYLTGSPAHVVRTANHRFLDLAPFFGMPSVLLALLAVAGCVTLMHYRRPAVAIALVLVWAEMFVLGVARRYPFLDGRTSTFLLELSLLVAALGVVGIVLAAAHASRVLAVVIVVGAALGYSHSVASDIRCHSIPFEDAGTMTQYVANTSRPGDTIIVSFGASYAFAYYLRHDTVQYVATDTIPNRLVVHVLDRPDVVDEPENRGPQTTKSTLEHALSLATAPGANGRIWILLSHEYASLEAIWLRTLSSFGLQATWVPTGSQPVLEVAHATSSGTPGVVEPAPVALGPQFGCGFGAV